MNDGPIYRNSPPLDRNAADLDPIFTDSTEEIERKQRMHEVVPDWWFRHAERYGLSKERTYSPEITPLLASLVPSALWLVALQRIFYRFFAPGERPPQWTAYLDQSVATILVALLSFGMLALKVRGQSTPFKNRAQAARWYLMHAVVPLGAFILGLKELLAAFASGLRGWPRYRPDALRTRAFRRVKQRVDNQLRARLANTWRPPEDERAAALAQGAQEAIRGLERVFEEAALDNGPPTRERLLTAYLQARASVELVERGPTGAVADVNGGTPDDEETDDLVLAPARRRR